MVSSADMSALHTCECLEMHMNVDWRLRDCIKAWEKIVGIYMKNGVCVDHLLQELWGWGNLQGLRQLKERLEHFKTFPYYIFKQGVKEGFCEGQAEVEKMMSSVLHMHSQIEQEILHLEKSVNLDAVKSILAEHQANPQPNFTEALNLLEGINVLPLAEQVKRRSEVRESIAKTLIARMIWEGEGYLPYDLTCDVDIIYGKLFD